MGEHRVGRLVERIGRAAGVKVGTRIARKLNKKTGQREPVEVPVFAGCHSYRRGFGSKWARRVAPSVLKRLMRHNSIATTEGYYVHLDASEIADELWTKYGEQTPASKPVYNNPTTSPPLKVYGNEREIAVSPYIVNSRGGARTRTSPQDTGF